MKTFSILFSFCFVLTAAVQAQDKTYIPNARQAVQKSRMQQPQYMELTKNPEIEETTKAEVKVQPSHLSQSVNYQTIRLVAIDAPKRRGNKPSISTFTRLASHKRR